MGRTTHDRQLDHHTNDLDTNIELDGATTNYSDGDILHTVISDLDDRIGSGGGGGGMVNILTGNDAMFTTTNGNWTASGGTLTHDSVHMINRNGSLKLVTTSTNQYVEVPVPGTFTSGTSYYAVIFIRADYAEFFSGDMFFGLLGTDEAFQTGIYPGSVSSIDFVAYMSQWTPSANRTGVKLRVRSDATAMTFYLGWALVFESDVVPVLSNNNSVYVPALAGYSGSYVGAHSSGGMALQAGAQAWFEAPDNTSGFDAGGGTAAFIFAEHTPGALAGDGVNIEVGDDYTGLYISEKDSTTIQIYDDAGGAYNIELVDQGSFGWRVVNTTYNTPMSNMHYSQAGTADPSAGGGVPAPIGATYHRNNSGVGELWLKTGSSNTAWSKFNNP